MGLASSYFDQGNMAGIRSHQRFWQITGAQAASAKGLERVAPRILAGILAELIALASTTKFKPS